MTLTLFFALAAVFVSIALLAGSAASYVLAAASPERKRLLQSTQPARAAAAAAAMALPKIKSVMAGQGERTGWQTLEKILPRSEKELNRLRTRLARGGISHPSAPFIYTTLEFLLPVIVGPLPLLYLEKPMAYFVAAAVGLGSYFIPGLFLDQRLNKRRTEIEDGLPDAL